jgi:hypothetical protein
MTFKFKPATLIFAVLALSATTTLAKYAVNLIPSVCGRYLFLCLDSPGSSSISEHLEEVTTIVPSEPHHGSEKITEMVVNEAFGVVDVSPDKPRHHHHHRHHHGHHCHHGHHHHRHGHHHHEHLARLIDKLEQQVETLLHELREVDEMHKHGHHHEHEYEHEHEHEHDEV